MRLKRVLTFFFIVVLLLTGLAPEAEARKKKRRRHHNFPTARSAMLWDVSSNKILYAKNVDLKVPPASTTKVMTAILAMEKLGLDQVVTVKASALDVTPTKLGARVGQQFSVRDLLHALLLKSANDAANVLAESVTVSQDAFVDLMNQRARQLGANNTNFANAHGLPSAREQYTTARDMALLLRHALKFPFFKEAIKQKYRIVYSKGGTRHFLKSHNKMLFMDWKKGIYGKTGFTIKAQSCFVGYYMHNNKFYIVDVFGCRRRWEDLKFIIERFGRVDL